MAHTDTASPRYVMHTRLLSLVVALLAASPILHAQEYTRTIERRFDIGSLTPIVSIETQFGSLTVTSTDDAVVTVRVDIRVEADDDERARSIGEGITLDATAGDGRVSLRTVFSKQAGASEKKSMRANMTVTVPKGTRLAARNRFGSTTITQVMGAVHCTAGFGEVTVSRSANVEVHNEFGNTTINGARGTTTVVSKNGRVRVWDIQGGRIESSFGNVEISKATAAVTVESRMGSIRATRLAGGTITCAYGSVEVELVRDFSGRIEAKTSFGSVSSDFDLAPREGSRVKTFGPESQDLVGRAGGGSAHLRVESSFGDITLRRGK